MQLPFSTTLLNCERNVYRDIKRAATSRRGEGVHQAAAESETECGNHRERCCVLCWCSVGVRVDSGTLEVIVEFYGAFVDLIQ